MQTQDFFLYKQIENNLNSLFDIEFPEQQLQFVDQNDKFAILNEFKKWFDFWHSKRPVLRDPDININKINKLFLMKIDICDKKIIAILNELQNIGLHEEFKKKYFH